jgi:hypothetical protein
MRVAGNDEAKALNNMWPDDWFFILVIGISFVIRAWSFVIDFMPRQ